MTRGPCLERPQFAAPSSPLPPFPPSVFQVLGPLVGRHRGAGCGLCPWSRGEVRRAADRGRMTRRLVFICCGNQRS